MMKTKLFLALALLFVSVICLVGCDKMPYEGVDNEGTRYEIIENDEMRYEVIKNDGNFFLRLINPYDVLGEGCTTGELRFDSLGDMKDRIENGKLTESELGIVYRHFEKNDAGDYPIPPLDDLKVPVLPEGIALAGWASWYGAYYEMGLDVGKEGYGYFYWLNFRHYTERKERALQKEDFTGGKTVHDEERDAYVTHYDTYAGNFCQVRYTVKGDATLTVIETYALSKTANSYLDESDVSDTIPCEVAIFGMNDGQYFHYMLYHPESPIERDWVSAFSMQDFEE